MNDELPSLLQEPSVHQPFPFFIREDLNQFLTDENRKVLKKQISHNIPQERYC
jgi:hypothetical protein